MRSLISICNIYSVVIWIVLSCSFSFSLTTSSANNWVSMHKPILWKGVYKCIRLWWTQQPCNLVVVFPPTGGSIMTREELTVVRRADRSSVVLSSRPRRGNEKDACKKLDALRQMRMSLYWNVYVTDSEEFSTHGGHALNLSKYRFIALNFILAPAGPYMRSRGCR